jgi:hypothetical protein
MGGLGTFTSTIASNGMSTGAISSSSSSGGSGALLELVGELRLEVMTLQALLARKEEEVEGLAARQRRLLSGGCWVGECGWEGAVWEGRAGAERHGSGDC